MNPVATPWPELAAAVRTFDPHVGPFPFLPFLRSWLDEVGEGAPLTLQSGENLLPVIEKDGVLRSAGASHLTDYHSPIGPDPASLASSLSEIRGEYRSAVFDSLPHGSAHSLAAGLRSASIEHHLTEDDPTAVLQLDSEDYLAHLSRKQRHETRRKRRRLVEALGEPQLVITEGDAGSLRTFMAMLRRAEGEKRAFMTDKMEAFFGQLNGQPGWSIAGLEVRGRAFAMFFGYSEPGCYYLYNSAYDLEYREVSPGVVALAELIQDFAGKGIMRFDLLKGSEPYKFRMGASPRSLYRIECR